MFAVLVWFFILTYFPTATNSPACSHHMGIKTTDTFSGSSTPFLSVTDISTEAKPPLQSQLSSQALQNPTLPQWNLWHNLTPIEQWLYFGGLQLWWPALCCPTDLSEVWQHSFPSCRPQQHPLAADTWGKPLCCGIITTPRCLQQCRAAALLPTLLWQEIFYPPAAVPTFPECLGSVKAHSLTLHLARAQSRGTNSFTPRVSAALFAHPAQSQCDQHLSGCTHWDEPRRVPQCPQHTDRAVTWAKRWPKPPQPHSMAQAPWNMPAQAPSDRVGASNTSTPEGPWANTLEGGSQNLGSCLHHISFPTGTGSC